MCGIAGIYAWSGEGPKARQLQAMADAVARRGPDDQGLHIDGRIGLAHRRLIVIDPSPAARCPMRSEDESAVLTYNGEIYNFVELRQELERRGHRFATRSDTEVLLQGYREWGMAVVERLTGMYAFALWDKSARTLWLVRDRFGEKPLYYAECGNRLIFASNIAGVVAGFEATPKIDPTAVVEYLCEGYILPPRTIWENVKALPAASIARVGSDGELAIETYWDLPDIAPGEKDLAPEEALGELETRLRASVRQRLVADVPVGGFLSGGVDSSLIMALAAQEHPGISTFSIGFVEPSHDETPHARQVAQHLGTDHHEFILRENDLIAALPGLVWQYGQPYGDSSSIPTHMVAQLARSNVTVALTGDGGDELFGGYRRAVLSRTIDRYSRWVPRGIRQGMVAKLAGSGRMNGKWMRLTRLNAMSLDGPLKGRENALGWAPLLGELLGRKAFAHAPSSAVTGMTQPLPGGMNTLHQILYDDIHRQLAGDFLVKVDVATMAASLESRAPFLDHRLAEWAWHLSDTFKVRGREGKWLLKTLAERHVPGNIVYRRKQGFAVPLALWLRGELGALLERLLQDSPLFSLCWLERAPILRALSEHREGVVDHATRLWWILWLDLWCRMFIEGSLKYTDSVSTAIRAPSGSRA